MLTKQDGKKQFVEVTFSLPAEVQGETVYLVGDFNNWDETAQPMLRDDQGGFFITLELEKDHEYQFRYLVNNNEWHNDWHADRYMPNPYSGDNSVVITSSPG